MVADFNKKRNREFFTDKLLFKTIGIVFLILISILAVADYRIYQKKKELNSQIIAYQKKIEDIKKSSQTLKEEIANADNKDYLEKLGYEQFDKTRPGETEYMFIKPESKTDVAPVQAKQNFWDVKLWWQGVAGWFKSKF